MLLQAMAQCCLGGILNGRGLFNPLNWNQRRMRGAAQAVSNQGP